jgi:hypothetical protein
MLSQRQNLGRQLHRLLQPGADQQQQHLRQEVHLLALTLLLQLLQEQQLPFVLLILSKVPLHLQPPQF